MLKYFIYNTIFNCQFENKNETKNAPGTWAPLPIDGVGTYRGGDLGDRGWLLLLDWGRETLS